MSRESCGLEGGKVPDGGWALRSRSRGVSGSSLPKKWIVGEGKGGWMAIGDGCEVSELRLRFRETACPPTRLRLI